MISENKIEEKKEVKQQVITLNFDCYEFFKFIETLEKYVDKLKLIFENRKLTICFTDYSRIMLSKCSMNVFNYTCENLDKMVFGINTSDLVKILRCRKTDKKEIELVFDNTKTFIQLKKTSKKYKSVINRTLNLIELESEVPTMDNLDKIEYPARVSFDTKFLDDFFYEASIFSEIVEIEINQEGGIIFSEEGQIGTSKYQIKKENCNEIEVKKEEDDKNNDVLNPIAFEKGSYSYTYLTPIKPLLKILTNSEIIFNLKKDNPIKLELRIESLDIDMVVYLAPRVEEAEWDDDDENDYEY